MVAVFIGSTAEVIKMAPVLRELLARGERPTICWTGMHGAVPITALADNELADASVCDLSNRRRGRPVAKSSDAIRWVTHTVAASHRHRAEIGPALATGPEGRRLLLVHGDTFSTVIGAEVGQRMRATVGHVEAGMRSRSILHPFPEELNRRFVAHRVDLHFAPTAQEVAQLAGARGMVVETGANTALDALRFALAGTPIVAGDYGVATLHRFELLRNKARLSETMQQLKTYSRDFPIRFYAGVSDLRALRNAELEGIFDERLELHAKVPHAEFARIVAGAAFVVTDSGGLQQECAYAGIPALIQRAHTESAEGLGVNVILSRFDPGVWARFFADPGALRAPSQLDRHHPSRVIADVLHDSGFLAV